ncbi:MAG: c-type cytochrome, partial [Rhizobacter sp.]
DVTTWRRTAAFAALASLALATGSAAHAQAKKPVARAGAASAAAAAPAVDYGEQFRTVCAACHGPNGRSDMPGVPVLAGQPSLYVITQLFLFREGRRHNEAMIALAKPMKDADLRGFSDFIGTLPPVPAPAPATPPDAARMSKGLALAQQHKCLFCHGADLAGGQQVPRIGGQKEDYVSAALHGFKSGDRPGYTRAMTEALSQVPVADLDVLAYYVANFTAK